MSQIWDRPVRSLRNTIVRPSGENLAWPSRAVVLRVSGRWWDPSAFITHMLRASVFAARRVKTIVLPSGEKDGSES
jgi:hypothetical protein